MSSLARMFIDRLLELLPVHTDAGRRIAAVSVPQAGPSALELADAACRRWLLGAIPPTNDALHSVAAALRDGDTEEELFELAQDVGALADDQLATTAATPRRRRLPPRTGASSTPRVRRPTACTRGSGTRAQAT